MQKKDLEKYVCLKYYFTNRTIYRVLILENRDIPIFGGFEVKNRYRWQVCTVLTVEQTVFQALHIIRTFLKGTYRNLIPYCSEKYLSTVVSEDIPVASLLTTKRC